MNDDDWTRFLAVKVIEDFAAEHSEAPQTKTDFYAQLDDYPFPEEY